jgi:hypothetical protein
MHKNKWIKRAVIGIMPILLGVTFAGATPDEAPCGVVLKSGKGVQVIPKQGSVQSHLEDAASIACASMVITHQDPFWIRLADQTVVKIAPQSFVEIPKTESRIFRLYRGQAFVSAPPGISVQTWSTPNSESIFAGGIAYFQYEADTRVSTVSCFNREFQFRNKFNENASTTVHAGEMSHLAIHEASVNPSAPTIMNHASVVQALRSLQMTMSDQDELVAIVKRVYQAREKSLSSEIEDWESEPTAVAPSRAIASVKGVAEPEKAIDPKEAEFVTDLLRAHLYGTSTDQKLVEPVRKPASAAPQAPIRDSEQKKMNQVLQHETKRLEKEIERIPGDEE